MKWQDLIFIIFFFLIAVCSNAQNNLVKHDVDIEIPEVALLGLVPENQSDITLTVSSPLEAGTDLDLSKAQNTSVWINYSSIIKNQFHKRKVIAVIQGEVPAGMHLTVEASECVGQGNGKLGNPVGKVILSDQPTNLIVNIGSCFTGRGSNNGHYLTYKLEKDESEINFDQLTDEGASVSVIYTLTDIN